jgi:hypothetical protein
MGKVAWFGGPPPTEAFNAAISSAPESTTSAAGAPGANRDRTLPIIKNKGVFLMSYSIDSAG